VLSLASFSNGHDISVPSGLKEASGATIEAAMVNKARFNMDEYQWATSEDVDAMLLFLWWSSPINPPTARQLRLFCSACCRQVWYCIHDRLERVAVELFENIIDTDTQSEVEHPNHAQMKAILPERNRGWKPHNAINQLTWHIRFPCVDTEMKRTREVATWLLDHSADDRAGVTWRACRPPYLDMLFALYQARDPNPTTIVGVGCPPSIKCVGWAGDEAEPLAIPDHLRMQIADFRRRECLGVDQFLEHDRRALWNQLRMLAFREQNRRLTDALRDIVGSPFPPIAAVPPLPQDVVAFAQSIYETQDYSRMGDLQIALENAGCRDREILGHCDPDMPHVRGCWVVDCILGRR
jgi:hypothetical protein